jgi:cytochrome c oxidase subunit 2
MKPIAILPESASNFAQKIDVLFWAITGLAFLFFLLVVVPATWFLIKYRASSPADRSNPVHHNTALEMAWSLIPFALGVGIFIWAAKLYVEMYTPPEGVNALEIRVVGKQWMWHLQHPTGQRENNELHLPAGRPVHVMLISQDVIHSFAIPAFRVKMDVLPGRYTNLWFTPTKPGRYRLFCAEFCGPKHSEMTGWVYVMEPAEYEKWLQETRWGQIQMETMAEAGERLYLTKQCGACHDPGVGKAPPLAGLFGSKRKLRDGREVVANEEYIRRSLFEPNAMQVQGYEPIMPTFQGQLDEIEVLQLIEYIKSLKTSHNSTNPEVKP